MTSDLSTRPTEDEAEGIDPVTFAVVRNALISCARQMLSVLKRTTMSPVLYEASDFGIALYDDRLNVVAEAPGVPVFVGSLDDCIRITVDALGGPDALAPGDVLLNNHPYLTAGQPVDAVLIEPIFIEGDRLIGYGAIRAHMGDFGAINIYPTNTTEIFQEGLLLPPLKLYEAGVLNDTVLRIIKANSRIPFETAGNVLASAGALRAGSIAVKDVIAKHGLDTYYATVDELLDHGERVARERLSRIPDGVYTYEGAADDDGVVLGVPVQMKVAVTIEGGHMTIDTTGSADQTAGPMNCPWGYTLATARFVLKCLATSHIPANSGERRVVTLVAPEGSMFNPVEPAPTWLSWLTSMQLADLIIAAITPALGDDMPSMNGGDVCTTIALLHDERKGRWAVHIGNGGPGHGAKQGRDGDSALCHPVTANFGVIPVEIAESRSPIIRRRFELEQDSGGAGQWRGGLGTVIEDEYLAAGVAGATSERTTGAFPVVGRNGGLGPQHLSGMRWYVGTDRERPVGKASNLEIRAGDVIESWAAGGGGYGDPLARDADLVARDVKGDYVSRDSAHNLYGVVLNEGFVVDSQATDERRAELRAARSDTPVI
jgi:N-methylhydantoinase B